MSSEVTAGARGALEPSIQGVARRAALRLAFGVTGCFVLAETRNWDVVFLAPLLAANMLGKLERPPSLAQGLLFIVLMALSTGAVLMLTTAVISKPIVLILSINLLVFLTFYAHRRGAPGLVTLLPQISAVTFPTIAVLSPATAGTFATTLVSAGILALMAVWAAHAAFPSPEATVAGARQADRAEDVAEPAIAARHALLDTLVLFPVLTWFILDASMVAVVVLITIVTLLRLPDREQGQRAALGLILGNLVGGIAAAVLYELLLLNDTFLFFITVCLAASLIFAGRIATAGDRAAIHAIAFATFILLLGTGISPLPGTSGEAFISRLLNVLLASAYAIGGLSLVERWRVAARA